MPHDKNGKLLKVGDTVNVPCIVKSVSSGEEYCNVTLETVEPMYPSDRKDSITLNAKQVEKVETPEAEGVTEAVLRATSSEHLECHAPATWWLKSNTFYNPHPAQVQFFKDITFENNRIINDVAQCAK
jgi:hypothetical protein